MKMLHRFIIFCTLEGVYIYIFIYMQGRTGHRENRDNSRWPGSQFGPLPYILFFNFFVVVFACRMYTKVIISEFAIQQ